MEKDIKHYKQRGSTCAICCMLMALNYYNLIDKINWYDERRLYRIYKSKYIDGVPFSAILYYLSKKNLVVSIYHLENNLFKNNKVFDDEIFNLLLNEYNEFLNVAIKSGAKVYNGVNINVQLLKEKLLDNNLIILAGKLNDEFHSILLSDCYDNEFEVYDPLCNDKKLLSFDEINDFMNTDIGKWFIVINDKL